MSSLVLSTAFGLLQISAVVAPKLTSRLILQPLSVELGPGILGNIFDGIQVCEFSASNLSKHVFVINLDC